MFSSDKIDQNYQNKPKLSMWPKEDKTKIEIISKRFSHVTHPHAKKTLEELNISTCHITGQIKFKINWKVEIDLNFN